MTRRNFFSLLVVLLLVFFGGEFFLRYFEERFKPKYFYVADQDLIWSLNPEIRPASQGFMESELDFNRLNEDNLIYAIGDSFVYGAVEYDKNYLTLIDESLNNYNVVNLGVGGYFPFQYKKMIEKYVAVKKPKVIFLNFFVGNDFEIYSPGSFSFIQKVLQIEDKKNFYSYWFKYLKISYRALYLKYYGAINKNNFSKQHFDRIVLGSSSPALINYPDTVDQGIKKNLEVVSEIIDYCKNNDIKLVFFILPAEYQVDEQVFAGAIEGSNFSITDYDLAKPQRLLTDLLVDKNINYVDLLPIFKEHAKNKKLYLNQNTHWNVAGNQLAANEILRQLESINLVD